MQINWHVWPFYVLCIQNPGYASLDDYAGIIWDMGWVNERRRHSVTPSLIGRSHTQNEGIILGMGSANERRRYYVTPPFIGRAHMQNDPCYDA